MADGLKTALAINALMKERKKLIGDINKGLSRQVAMQIEYCKQLKCASDAGSGDDAVKRTEELTAALRGSADAAEETSKKFKKMRAAASGVTTIFGALRKLGSKVAGIFGTALTTAVGLAVSAYKAFVTQAAKVYDEMVNVARSAEQVRGRFGSLAKGPGKKVIEDARTMGRTFNKLGIGMKFGYAAGSQMNEMLNKMKGEMDPSHLATFDKMSSKTRTTMLLYGKAVGMGGKEVGYLNQRMKALGKDGPAEMEKIAKISMKLQDVLGVTAKDVGKAFASMQQNVKIFGDMSSEQIGDAIAMMTQLGVGVKELEAVGSAFFSFDKAAENVSKLSQAFGTNIDTMKMLNAASPAEQIDEIRNAMFAAGKSAESMSRHEKALLGDTLGLSAAQAELMFSQEAQYMTQDELDKAMDDQDPQKAMVNGLKDVADQIEKVINSLGDMGLAGKGFFGSFMTGLGQGLFRFGKFGKTAKTTGQQMIGMRDKGKKFAKMLTDEGGPLENMFEDIEKAIGKIGPVVEKLMKPVGDLMAALGEGDADKVKAAFSDLGTIIKEAFTEIFVDTGMVDAVKKALMSLWVVASNFFLDVVYPYVVDVVGPLLTKMVEAMKAWAMENKMLVAAGILLILGPSTITAILKGATTILGGLGSGIGRILSMAFPSPPDIPGADESEGFFSSLKGIVCGLAAIAKLGIKTILQAAAGAAVLGVLIAIGITPLALTLIGLAKLAGSDIGGVTQLAIALGIVMLSMTPMIAIGAVLGAMMMTSPFGLAGVALIGAGFLALGGLIGAFMNSLIPVIKALASVAKDIPNPRSVVAVASALKKVVGATVDLMNALGPIMKTLKPGLFSKNRNESFATNIKLFTNLISTIMSSLTGVINTLVSGAQAIGADPQTIAAAEALGNLIGAVASLMAAIAPNLDAMQESHAEYGQGYSERSTSLNLEAFKSLGAFYEQIGPSIGLMIDQVITGLIETVAGREDEIKTAAETALPVFEGIASLMNAVRGLTGENAPDFSDADKFDGYIMQMNGAFLFLSKIVNKDVEPGKFLVKFIGLLPSFMAEIGTKLGDSDLGKLVSGIKSVVNAVTAINSATSALGGMDIAGQGVIRSNIRAMWWAGDTLRRELFADDHIKRRNSVVGALDPLGYGPGEPYAALSVKLFITGGIMLGVLVPAVRMMKDAVGGLLSPFREMTSSASELTSIMKENPALGFDIDVWENSSQGIYLLVELLEFDIFKPLMRLSTAFWRFRPVAERLNDAAFGGSESNLGLGSASSWKSLDRGLRGILSIIQNMSSFLSDVVRDLTKLNRSARGLTNIIRRHSSFGFDIRAWESASSDIYKLVDLFEYDLKRPMDRLSDAFEGFQATGLRLNKVVFGSGVANLGLGSARQWRDFARDMKQISRIFKGAISANTDSLAESVADFAIAIPKITESIRKLDVVKIQAVMAEKGAQALLVQGDETTVETNSGAPSVAFHINITMDADKVAEACINTSLIPGTLPY